MVGETADRVDGLLGRSCRYQELFAGKVFLEGGFLQDIFQKGFRLRHFSGSGVPACQVATGRCDHLISVGLQLPDIVLYHGILIHGGIHGRCKDFLTPAGHYRSGEHIVRKAVGQLSDHVCTGRCDHHNICLLGNGYVLYLELKVPVKGIHQAFIPGQCFKCDRIDKVRCILCHQYMDICMKLM